MSWRTSLATCAQAKQAATVRLSLSSLFRQRSLHSGLSTGRVYRRLVACLCLSVPCCYICVKVTHFNWLSLQNGQTQGCSSRSLTNCLHCPCLNATFASQCSVTFLILFKFRSNVTYMYNCTKMCVAYRI